MKLKQTWRICEYCGKKYISVLHPLGCLEKHPKKKSGMGVIRNEEEKV